MLDSKFIRQNPDAVKEAIRKKRIKFDFDEFLKIDEARLVLLDIMEKLRAKQNDLSAKIPSLKDDAERSTLLEELKTLKEELKTSEVKFKETDEVWQQQMLKIPNVPDPSVPEGEDDYDNLEVKVWGDKPKFKFKPKDHTELLALHNMCDFERGSKVHGFRGYFLKNDGAMLSFAIWNYAMAFFGSRGFTPFIPPIIVRRENFFGTGHLPNDAEDLYETQDGDNLAGTAEVPMMGYHRDEVLDGKEFPIKYLAFSPCYRREAGSYGKDVKGLVRVHEFYKIEQIILCEANHEESVRLHEMINRNSEEFIESLGIPYHTVLNCGGDLGLGQVKKYDIELWVPSQEKYREISSASYFHDFQTRRFNIKYRDSEGTMRYAHSLNSTAIPTPRILVSLLENNQNEDGSVNIPEALIPYLGKSKIELQ